MSRLRFIVDRPRGPRGGHHDERYLYASLSSAKVAAAPRTGTSSDRPAGRIFTVDLDDLLPFEASIWDQLQFHEHRMLHHTTELQRLGNFSVGDAPILTTTDMAQIREAVSEWHLEEDRLRRGGGATPAAAGAFFLMRDLWRAGKLG